MKLKVGTDWVSFWMWLDLGSNMGVPQRKYVREQAIEILRGAIKTLEGHNEIDNEPEKKEKK